MKQHKGYLIKTFLIGAIGLPLLVQVVFIGGLGIPVLGWLIGVPALAGITVLIWARRATHQDLPESALFRYLPLLAAFGWYMLSFVLCFGIAGYQYGSLVFDIFPLFALPWFSVNFMLMFMGDYTLFPVVQVVFYGINIGIFAACIHKAEKESRDMAKCLLAFGMAALLCGVCGIQLYARSKVILTQDPSVLKIEDEVRLSDYAPFRQNNLLQRPDTPPSLAITSDYPRLDGATAAYPVYGAMVQSIYKGLDRETVREYVDCTKTMEAYQRLIDGEVDIFFGAQPSAGQREAAAASNVEFFFTPIAREAFVFFVNRKNPVTDLSVEEIQDIYQKKITNWSKVGGDNEKILPFQRPEGSGSQTIMVQVMGGKTMPDPPIEEMAAGMVGVMNAVAAYRNYEGAIGYSFRYFATGMNPSEDIRLLAINGVEPTVENIRTEVYPFTQTVYAVTTSEPEGNVKALLDWILSHEGQALIEKCGYVAAGNV